MKFICLFVAFIALASAAKQKKPIAEYFTDFAAEPNIGLIINDDDRPPSTFVGDEMKAKTTSINTMQGNGKFNFNFETENGINVASIGKLKDEKTFVVTGSYTYTGADGKRYRVRYTADEFGYHPVTELDDQPEIEIIPAKPIPPTPRPSFNPITSFNNGNNPRNGNNQQSFSNAQGFLNGPNFNNGQNAAKNHQLFQYDQGFGNFGSRNGFTSDVKSGNRLNSIDGFSKFEARSGKSLKQNGVLFNEHFASVQEPRNDDPNRQYLPPNKAYLPPN